jgi:tetratricopeptide (TPR) repeat protein
VLQAARIAELHRLENTLVNNLGTTLLKMGKLKRAVALHRMHLARVEEVEGLHSQFIYLARHNLVEALRALGKHDDADAILRQQCEKMEAYARDAATRKERGEGRSVSMVAASTEAEAKGEEAVEKEEAEAAGQAVARAHFDLSKFLQSRGRHAEAVEEARVALQKEREAVGPVRVFVPFEKFQFCLGFTDFPEYNLRRRGRRRRRVGRRSRARTLTSASASRARGGTLRPWSRRAFRCRRNARLWARCAVRINMRLDILPFPFLSSPLCRSKRAVVCVRASFDLHEHHRLPSFPEN